MKTKSTVLIVDDESGPRESLKMLLKSRYRVEEADGGLRAMQIIRKRKVDLVTLDLKMPGMDGVAVLKSIKEYDPHIEVMVITGYGAGAHGSVTDLIQLGASSYHTKPFNVPELMVEIARVIDNKKKFDRSNNLFPAIPIHNRIRNFRIPLISISSFSRLEMPPTSNILIQDICSHGIGIHSPEKFNTGEFVRVQFIFAAKGEESITESIVGEVVWTSPLRNGITHLTRIRFDHIGEDNPRLLAYIKRVEEMN
jgi:CheY-like chemotaxis protein